MQHWHLTGLQLKPKPRESNQYIAQQSRRAGLDDFVAQGSSRSCAYDVKDESSVRRTPTSRLLPMYMGPRPGQLWSIFLLHYFVRFDSIGTSSYLAKYKEKSCQKFQELLDEK